MYVSSDVKKSHHTSKWFQVGFQPSVSRAFQSKTIGGGILKISPSASGRDWARIQLKIIPWNRDFIRLITDYRELQYFYFFKYFGHFLCLQNRIFFSSDSIWKKGFSSWSCRGWCIFFLVGKSSTQKKVQKGLHTYAHDTIVDFRPGIMIDPFYEWSSITGLTVYNQSFLAHSFRICQFCLILFGINLRNGEPCSVWSKAKRLAAKDSKRCDLHSTITYNT